LRGGAVVITQICVDLHHLTSHLMLIINTPPTVVSLCDMIELMCGTRSGNSGNDPPALMPRKKNE